MAPSLRSKSIQRYSEERPDLAPTLAFFDKLWTIQDTIAESAPDWQPPAADEIESALASQRIVFAISSPQIPAEQYRDALRSVIDLLADEGGLPEGQAAGLKDLDLDAVATDEAIAEILKGVDAFISEAYSKMGGEDSGVPVATLSFVITTALTPFLVAGASKALSSLERFDWARWASGLCPVCGTPASFGRVTDGGQLKGGERVLSCPLCRAEWGFNRLQCARCGERFHEKLEYLFDEKDSGHRIHTCKTCKGYLKVSFEKELSVAIDPAVEEVVMLALDAVAAERGFSPLGEDDTPVAN